MTDRPTPTPPSPGSTREAYLDLLKLALCDLVEPRTDTVNPQLDDLFAYELPEDLISTRVEGRDWPLRARSMAGYERLGDLQRCVESVVADGIEGDVIETGVWRGGASILARATLDSLGERDRTVWLADSFRGLPPPDEEAFPQDRGSTFHRFDYLAAPREEVAATFARLGLDHDLAFVEGFFTDTMPGLRGHPWAIVRLDGDMYESTWVTIEALYPTLSRGGYCIVDDYGIIEQCRQAVHDYRREHSITAPIEWVDHTCVRWRREDEPAEPRERVAVPTPADEAAQPQVPLPTQRERALEQRIAQLESELGELRARSVRGRAAAAARELRRRLR